jgi:hypothetical protein
MISRVGGGIDLSAGRAEVYAAGVERINGQGAAQDIDVAVLLGQPVRQRLPLVPARAAAVDPQLSFGG